jgi:hypothetical protein
MSRALPRSMFFGASPGTLSPESLFGRNVTGRADCLWPPQVLQREESVRQWDLQLLVLLNRGDQGCRYLYKGMARHNVFNTGTPGVSVHATSASSVIMSGGAAREFGVSPSRGDGGGMSVLLSWHEKVYASYPTLLGWQS